MITIMSWLWRQNVTLNTYTAEHVNTWAAMVRRNVTIPHRLACVTDMPEGIDPSIEIIPLPDPFGKIHNQHWRASAGKPQCYRRLDVFRRDAADTYGDRICWMDLDSCIGGNLDALLTRDTDFAILESIAANRPYNGSMVILNAGARPQVFDRFTPRRAEAASQQYVGSDQAWLAYVLGWCEDRIGESDGVYCWTRRMTKIPKNCKVLMFPGRVNPWDYDKHRLDWVKEHYRIEP